MDRLAKQVRAERLRAMKDAAAAKDAALERQQARAAKGGKKAGGKGATAGSDEDEGDDIAAQVGGGDQALAVGVGRTAGFPVQFGGWAGTTGIRYANIGYSIIIIIIEGLSLLQSIPP